MAKTSTQRFYIFINGKEVETSVKQLQAKTSHIANNQNQENFHKYLRPTVNFSSLFKNLRPKRKYSLPLPPQNHPLHTSYLIRPTFPPNAPHHPLPTFHFPPRGAALPLHGLRLAQCGSDGGQVPECESVRVLREQSGAFGGPGREGNW